ncbi:hypothetical protein [Brevundimonas sp.]|uniref:hypothetical protein n=1 Tax=Brevundimonas sp. TaxID=1871086 RepID=UPI002D61FEA2|nr:hypothetical protein [Brevundimonas sp.]HYC99078.1 hypothetical protein [Brevundimonas sp.]
MPLPPPRPPEADPAARLLAARLLEGLQGLDLTSADGRAGIGALLAEIERLSPGAILQQAARIELRRVGWPSSPGRSDPCR